jgi:hypothetical protein
MFLPLPSVLVATPLIIGVAERVPNFNLSAVCSAMSEGGAEACIRSESAARDDLTKQWSQFPAADRARCVQLATMTKTGSYVQVLTCVEMAREARQLKAPGQHR